MWKDEELVPIRPPRHRALLALLLLRANKVISQEELIEAALGRQTSRARRGRRSRTRCWGYAERWAASVLETQPSGYRLRVTDGQLDLERFEYLIEQARGRPAAERGALLREALALWRGLPLVEFPFEAALQAEVLRLEELHLGALEARIESDLALGRHAETRARTRGSDSTAPPARDALAATDARAL